MRSIERWLHQHIFKVGWLLTQNFKTTTILYYTFFLPGVVLHELVYWLAAGILNVRAERAIKWPEPQEIGELRLNFVQISPRAGIYRRAIIAIVPLVAGLTLVWWIANNILDINAVAATISTGELEDVAAGVRQLTGASDFWLWFYILFTISNTMYPAVPKDLRGWRTVAGATIVIIITLFVIGIGNEIFQSVAVPFGSFLSVLQNILLLIIGCNLFMTVALGTIEYALEAITGRSATFKKGKMITMTRAEAIEQRQKAREREQKQLATARRNPAAVTGPPSVYRFSFPIPGGPGEEAVTQPAIQISGLPDEKQTPAASISGKAGADLIAGEATPVESPPEPIIRIGGSLIGQPRTPETSDEPAAETPVEPAPPAPSSTPTFPISPPVFKTPVAKQVEQADDKETEETAQAVETAQAIEDATSILAAKVNAQETMPDSTAADKPEKSIVEPTSEEDEDEAVEEIDESEKADTDEPQAASAPPLAKPAASLSPFYRPLTPTTKPVIEDDEDEDDEDEFEDDDEEIEDSADDEDIADAAGKEDASTKPGIPTTPPAFKRPAASLSPFARPPAKPTGENIEDEDGDEDEEESLLRRGRAADTDAVSDLFKDLMGERTEKPSPSTAFPPVASKLGGSLSSSFRKPVPPSSGSLFGTPKSDAGTFKPAPKPTPDDEDDEDLDALRYVDDEEYVDYDEE